MFASVGACGFAALLTLSMSMSANAQSGSSRRPWKGYSILGNGNLTAVYSDDRRISALTHAKGIQHLYFGDYTADYIASTSFELLDQDGNAVQAARPDVIWMKNFFTAQTQTRLSNGSLETVLCFVHPEDAVVLSLNVTGGRGEAAYKFEALLRTEIKTDRSIALVSLDVQQNMALATWSNGTALAICPKPAGARITANKSSVSIAGSLSGAESAEVLVVPGLSPEEAFDKASALRQKDVESGARQFWESWMSSGRVPFSRSKGAEYSRYVEAYKRNLYCVKSANLRGQIPADITGQFVTNNMPQLYPRDAMMCARVFLATGHSAEAKEVIEFWAKREIPMKSPGEWFARYDAHAKAVDSGSGARYDEPEWDSNGYYIYLVNQYHEQTGAWLGDRNFIYELADFLVSHIDPNGLLYEGGIVEWTGYLPATNMICAAALETAAKMADDSGNAAKSATYKAASARISAGLPYMFDRSRKTYADVRFAEAKDAGNRSIAAKSGAKVYLWDTTANVGVIWGYPNHSEIALSNAFYAKNTAALGGGMRYFDSPDPGLAAYGHGFFFFTTAAAAEYESRFGSSTKAKRFVDWMLHNANSYGLMPEHINPDGLDCSPASPLSWCCAEFAIAALSLLK